VKQVEGARARLEDNLYEMSKPLTRTEDDVDRENLLKDQVGDERVILNCPFQYTEQRCC
jgi:hypothetical protein